MKNFILLLFCAIFGFSYAQKNEQLFTEAKINQEIAKAKQLSTKDLRKTIEISKKAYESSKIIDYKKGMLESNTLLMAKYFDMGNFKKVIELSREAEKISIETEDNETLSNTYRLRAQSYTELGFNNESHKEFLKALNTTKNIESKNFKLYQKALIYNGLASYSAHTNTPIDSVIYYQKKSLDTVIKIDDNNDYINKKYLALTLAYINLGMTSNASHRIKDAEIYFSKALAICQNKKYNVNLDLEVKTLNEFAWLYYDQKNYDKATSYAEQAEQMEKQLSLPYIRRDIYEVMFKSYVEKGQKESSSKYMNLYTKLNDSLVNVEKKTINTPIKHMMDEQGKINTTNIRKIIITSSSIFLILILAGCFFWRKKQKLLDKRYETFIASIKKGEEEKLLQKNKLESDKDITEYSMSIADDTTTAILRKLSKFESSKKFINKDISLAHIANSLETNTRYLSEIIKQYKCKSFNNYINGLRINYITELLYKDPKYREYKISYLAEVCGFASREVFAVVFKKETGVTPSYFISKLRTDITEKEL